MRDFVKFCPHCRAFFRDPERFFEHIATCKPGGREKSKAAKASQEAPPEPGAESPVATEESPEQKSSESVTEPSSTTDEPSEQETPPEPVAESPKRGRPPKFPN
jgi:hypothetical protein